MSSIAFIGCVTYLVNETANATTKKTQVTPSDQGRKIILRQQHVPLFSISNTFTTPTTTVFPLWLQRGLSSIVGMASFLPTLSHHRVQKKTFDGGQDGKWNTIHETNNAAYFVVLVSVLIRRYATHYSLKGFHASTKLHDTRAGERVGGGKLAVPSQSSSRIKFEINKGYISTWLFFHMYSRRSHRIP